MNYKDAPLSFDGDKRRFLMSQYPLFITGILRGQMLFLKDVSHLTEAEAQIRELNTILTARAEAVDEKLQQAYLRIRERQYKEEIARMTTLTLHNVRNVMTTIKISSEFIMSYFTSRPVLGLYKANSLLRENMDNPEHFLLKDEKGKLLLEYYLQLEKSLEEEKNKVYTQYRRLETGINNADQIIAIQQGWADGQTGENNTHRNH